MTVGVKGQKCSDGIITIEAEKAGPNCSSIKFAKHNGTTQLFKLATCQVNPITWPADGSDTDTIN